GGGGGAILDAGIGQASPARAAVVAPIHVDRRAAGIDALGVPGIHQERPDLLALVGKIRALERGATIGAAPHAIHGAGEYHVGVDWMHEDRMGLQVRQHMLPLASVGGTAEDADAALLVRAPDIASHASVDVRLSCHETFLLSLPLLLL